MSFFLHYTPRLLHQLAPRFTWHIPTNEKTIFLTFDDGPIPEVTEFVLDQLNQFDAKATFFCIGDNVRKYTNIFNRILQDGHSAGNHTFNHLKGWSTPDEVYLKNWQECQSILPETRLFRPPYGRITLSQARSLPAETQIIMWDVLSGDFSKEITPENCLHQSIRHTKAGSIVVFHDSHKASENMTYALPRYLEHFKRQGFRFEALPM
ncbi:polysaccharide deacetylase family protein [Arundinibacter roseus]|uniref:Polysaccharide deacetylase family protein n=1 Tax=Arundinibacter roseus TaxID=2070510 RepID=A0A4R4K9H5_9BACT|nr:polysaccharide deacetylase family protein [Arundinibacter roseus]TDB64447.1 polysaccharide deacetylase family protein [Arundinibacter roseus]